MKKSTQLKNLINSENTEYLMEAHSGLSAKIVEEAGFKGIWGSGLAISASLGVRDNNEVAWTQILDVMEFMSDSTNIPILLDGDTGYGNFNNMRRLVKKLEQRDIAGVCIEDKIFPKTNSFLGGNQHPLADIDEFCGKIKAGKDSQQDPDFCIVARVEAFIAGWGLKEALARAYAYSRAGADAILIHSKLSNANEILLFMDNWDRATPVIIVPTKYYETPTEVFENCGVSVIIWANHTVRSSIAAMSQTVKQIQQEKTLTGIESKIVPIKEVFRLQDLEEYTRASEKYLPVIENPKAIILAASRGESFGELTADKPKCMLEVLGKTILQTQIETLNDCGIKDISVVVGYKKKAVAIPGIQYMDNPAYESRGLLYSYLLALQNVKKPVIISFGDTLFEASLVNDLMQQDGDIILAVDTSWWQAKRDREMDMVVGRTPPSEGYLSEKKIEIVDIGTHIQRGKAHGEWTGLMKLSSTGVEILKSELGKVIGGDSAETTDPEITKFIMMLVQKGIRIDAYFFRGHWLDVDSPEDLLFAKKLGGNRV